MPTTAAPPDPLEAIPDPETVRVMLADAIRRRDLLRSLLRVAVRKASYPRPARRPARPAIDEPKGVTRG
jgi:hypothetical protein